MDLEMAPGLYLRTIEPLEGADLFKVPFDKASLGQAPPLSTNHQIP
jgi:hypothetical protein